LEEEKESEKRYIGGGNRMKIERCIEGENRERKG